MKVVLICGCGRLIYSIDENLLKKISKAFSSGKYEVITPCPECAYYEEKTLDDEERSSAQ